MVKKVPDGTQRKTPSVRELIEQNKWNPFERVDPKILEHMHRKACNKNKPLEEYEDALI